MHCASDWTMVTSRPMLLLLFVLYVGQCSRTNLALRRPSRQSSTCCGGSSERAVDGNIDQKFFHKSCSHTPDLAGQWWEVDLLGFYKIDEVIIYNRGDCCDDWLHNFYIDVYLNDRLKFKDEKPIVCATYPGVVGSSVRIKCQSDTRGRFLKISLIERGNLVLCEVQVYGEAVKKAGIQFGPQTDMNWISTYNVDGASILQCGKSCFKNISCFNFFYNVQSDVCEFADMQNQSPKGEPWIYFSARRLLSGSHC